MFGIDDIIGAMVFSALASAVASTVVGAVGTGVNAKVQTDINEENLAYAQGMTEEQWRRDDSSLQRQVIDAKKAGLSPLAVTGAMNSSSPLNYQAQAPQMDLASLIGGISSFDNVTEALGKKADFEHSDKQQDKDLTNDLFKFNRQLEANQKLQDDQLAQDIIKFNKTLAYQYDELNEMSLQNAQKLDGDRLIHLSNQTMELYSQVSKTIGLSPRVEYVTDYKTYIDKFNSFMVRYNELLNDPMLVDNGKTTSASTSEQMSASALKNGVSFGDSASQSYDVDSAVLRDLYATYIKDYAIPILVDDKSFLSRKYKLQE